MAYIGTNLEVSIFFRPFSYKVLAEINMFGKARKDGKTKTAFKKKRICDAIVVSFNFFLLV